jgi:hypothetical protein
MVVPKSKAMDRTIAGRWSADPHYNGSMKLDGSRCSRRAWLAAASAGGACVCSQRLCGQDKSTPAPVELVAPQTQQAIDRGLAWLAKRQILSGRSEGAFGHSGYQGGVAVASLAGLAFMTSGNPPGQGPLGKHIDRCTKFITANVQENGYVSVPVVGQDNMYGHGFATLYLSEVYGMSDRRDLDATVGQKLRQVVKLTCACQNDAGGWRYQPEKSDADLSVTIAQIMGLRAARDAGIHVPDGVRTKCIDYVRRSQNPDGGFRYQLAGGGSTFPLTAAGIVSLYSAGIYEGEPIEKALAWLMKHLPGKSSGSSGYFFYGQYYAVQAMWHAGGDYWAKWYPAIRDLLLGRQSESGAWPDNEVCPEFGTAMACIILQMPNNFLPIFTP